jgi:putative endonuclease
VIDRNWRCIHGEVDVVARLGNRLLFCEVRTRRGQSRGTPQESITPAKAARMARVAQAWLSCYGPHTGPIRLDVLGWLVDRDGTGHLAHIEGVQL